jgi:hypothetical protein
MKITLNLDGPYPIKTPGDGGKNIERPCYIVVGFESGVFTVYEPKIELGGTIYAEQWELAKEDKKSGVFAPYGKNHYLN